MMHNSRLLVRFEWSVTATSEVHERQYCGRFPLHVHTDIALGH
jgi:hypothetical protein